ncbi:MAG: DUF84 family protein [Holophagales bacterium]|nr:MAG: DUF84 family protein [Holophagales bacterium]
MASDLREFWHRFQTGVEVAVAGTSPDVLLGVREGLLRFFHDGLDRPVPVAVVPQEGGSSEPAHGLALSDEEIVAAARSQSAALRDRLLGSYHLYIGTAGGLHSLEFGDSEHYFVRNWTSVVSPAGEAVGSSGSIQLPGRLVAGLEREQLPFAMPGTRRSGGLFSSLTGGLESRRSAVALSTLHAVSSLFYGVLQSAPVRRRP